MKKKRSMIVLAIFVAVLVLGVGYAAITGVQLSIDGSASVTNRDLAVSFTNAGATGATCTAAAVNGELEADLTVTGLSAVGQSVTATYTIQNEEDDLDALISLNTVDNPGDQFFEVTTSLDSADLTVGAADTETVTVTVTLIAMPITTADSTATFTITFDAEAQQP